MMRSRPGVLKTLFEASTETCLTSENIVVAKICGTMQAAGVVLGATGPVNRSADAGKGEKAGNKVGTLVGEDSSLGRFREWGGDVSWLTDWPPGNAMVDAICCRLLETASLYRGSSGLCVRTMGSTFTTKW